MMHFPSTATIVRRLKVWTSLLQQKSNNNKDDNNDSQHIDETACMRDAGKD
jgi:hypothetical protein